MTWQYTPYTIPLIVAAVLCTALAVFGWQRRPAPGSRPFAVGMLGGTVLSLSAALQGVSVGLPQKLWFNLPAFLGIVILPATLVVLVAEVTGHEAWTTRRSVLLLTIEPLAVMGLILTNDAHHLFFMVPRWNETDPLWDLSRIFGAAFWVHAVYSYGLLLAACVLLIRARSGAAPLHRRQILILLLAGLAPWLADVMYVTGLNPFRPLHLTPFCVVLTGLAIAWSLTRLQLLDIVPVARDAIIDHMSDGMIALDQRDRIVFVNPAARAIVIHHAPGFEPIGRSILDIMPDWPDLVERYRHVDSVQAEITLGEGEPAGPFHYEFTISPLHDNGGRRTGRLIALRDITARKETEAALRRSEERYRRIVEAAQEGIWMCDADGRTQFANRRMAEMLGYTAEELQGRAVYEFFHPDMNDAARDHFLTHRSGKPGTLDRRFARRDGADLWAIVNTSPITDAGDRLVGALSMLTDITERKRMEDELRQHREHLEELIRQRTAALEKTNARLQTEIAERERAEARMRASLQEKEALLKEVHHRVKNNLQIISSLLYLQSRDIADPTVLQMFRDSQDRVRSMALVHERLYQSGDLARVDFGEYVRNLTAYLFRTYAPSTTPPGTTPGPTGPAPGAVKLTIDVPTALLGIDQAIPCGLIINELVSNALKHAFPADGGRSGVIAPTDASGVGATLCDRPPSGCDRPADEITVRLRRNDAGRLVLTVADNGVGFPEGEDFRRTPSLGLQLVNTLVRQLGADIELNRRQGAEFRITLR